MGKLNINPVGIDLIVRFEGFRPKPYKDAGGVVTIGYGHTRSAIMPSQVTEQEALQLLREDLEYFERVVATLVRVPINENQFSALVSFAYNVGEGALRNSTLLRKLNSGDYPAAAAEFSKWTKAGQQELKGLVRRRSAEEQLFRTPPPITVTTHELSVREAWETLTEFDGAGAPVGLRQGVAEGAVILIMPGTRILQPVAEVPSDDELQQHEVVADSGLRGESLDLEEAGGTPDSNG